jgi:DNA-binding LacI/PurR family transcriptional regulator
VSIWTASNTFSNPDRVAEATRQRVLDAADALDYAGPNPGARSLALGRTGMVALISPGDASLLLSDPAAALVAQGLLTTCDRAGLSLVFCGQEGTQLVDARVVVRGSVNAGVRGPVVVVDGEARGDTPQVRAEADKAARDIARHLVELGHRTIAVIASDTDGVRLTAATEALADIDHLAVYRSPGSPWPTTADGEAAARAAFAHRPRPTALLAVTDTLAVGALEAAHRMGLRVPRDVSISGIDDLPGSDARGLTTALVPYRPMGELAGQALVERLDGRPTPALPVLPVPLVLRATTAPPQKRR